MKDRTNEPLGLAQGQAENRAQHQRRRDRQGGIVRLPTRLSPRLSSPGVDRFVREPHGQAAALPQGGIILTPVRDTVGELFGWR